MKIIRVESCMECPYYNASYCYGDSDKRRMFDPMRSNPGTIPDWCPLEEGGEDGR